MCVYMYICMYCEFSYYKGNAIYSSMFRYFLYHYIYIYLYFRDFFSCSCSFLLLLVVVLISYIILVARLGFLDLRIN